MLKHRVQATVVSIVFIFSILLTACGGAANNDRSGAAVKDAVATTRTFETQKGIITIPAKPQRIVTDYYGGELLAVGGKVVGVDPETFANPYLKEQLKTAKDVGNPINQEKVLELAPDLIVVMNDKDYDALSKIAPTLHIPYGTVKNVHDTLRFFGDIVGDKEKAEQFIAEFDKKAAEGRANLEGVIAEDATFGIYEVRHKGDLWIFGDNGGRGGQALYNALQLKMQPKLAISKEQGLQLSMETLPEYAADYMFLTNYDPENTGEALKQLKDSSVWNGLPASKDNKVFYNDFHTFYSYDPIAIMAQIDLFTDMLIARAEENKKK
ncbi:ABC transporter substrate-binding protein [Paenibacillus sp. GSMTC-2017]|uniref:ABC transporter substrate-binding protein n=1 Tax=Paenibacillus sp. GSMTC-2017 TaxID=2794350 RepID=UPI0018D6A74B|nr:ABC transporter substrate-binding protein [Paenibacillus sp. GSMTC-2017]MBH5316305.1 ABC transporter substrate-binding protein [Paenibacillus sp. GSMTC-2017]